MKNIQTETDLDIKHDDLREETSLRGLRTSSPFSGEKKNKQTVHMSIHCRHLGEKRWLSRVSTGINQ